MLDLDALETLDRALTDPQYRPEPQVVPAPRQRTADTAPEARCPHLAAMAAA